ncbi:(+)-eremophilene synthase [Drechslerella dactyloides]|uniref:Terpene synthase n=1 Tax=Drechslerella dactyloides TaxID=74499 RepID=A0AAD6NN10_DREDA|nr:(+)-eremophilene synthase [Drechslerella dactyloides]
MVDGSAATQLTPTLAPEISGDTELILVEIPEFFKSIMAADAAINPWYTDVKMAGHAWAAEILGFSETISQKILEADFALMAAAFIPFGSKEQLRGLVDWLYWVAMFDDRIDEGDLRNDPIGAATEILETLAVLDDEYPMINPKDNPVRSNDIISLKKDLAFGTEANLIIVLMKQGNSLQEAMNRADEMLDECYKTWDNAFQAMPKWGEEIDRQVLQLVEAYRVLALGNIDWSFRTTRYLGETGAEVRATRILAIPEEYIQKYDCNN